MNKQLIVFLATCLLLALNLTLLWHNHKMVSELNVARQNPPAVLVGKETIKPQHVLTTKESAAKIAYCRKHKMTHSDVTNERGDIVEIQCGGVPAECPWP